MSARPHLETLFRDGSLEDIKESDDDDNAGVNASDSAANIDHERKGKSFVT